MEEMTASTGCELWGWPSELGKGLGIGWERRKRG